MVISPQLRKSVHIGLAAGALLLPYVSWWQSISLGAIAVTLSVLLLPGLPGHALLRQQEPRLASSILLYVLGVLLLVVVFPSDPQWAAAGWGILAAGDGLSTLAGRAVGGVRWPWNRDKSIAGSAAFVLGGWTLSVALAAWTLSVMAQHGVSATPARSLLAVIAICGIASIVAAFVETIPVRLNDNLSVPAAAAFTFWCANLMAPRAINESVAMLLWMLGGGLLLNAACALAAWRVRGVSASGAIVGALLGTIVFAGAGWAGWLLFGLSFAAAWGSSHLGLARKRVLGIDEAHHGKRGAGNALANTGLAAVAALVALFSPYVDAAHLALAVALTAGASDTVASEIGKAWGGRTWLITTFAQVKPGSPGGISVEGTCAGLAAAFVMALAAWTVGLVPGSALWLVVVAATVGATVESALAATLEAHRVLNNDILNFLNTLAAAIVALMLF